ncbi:MAG: hypothetical protein ACT4PJ_06620 [Gemmatimonadaceae bacterium]
MAGTTSRSVGAKRHVEVNDGDPFPLRATIDAPRETRSVTTSGWRDRLLAIAAGLEHRVDAAWVDSAALERVIADVRRD